MRKRLRITISKENYLKAIAEAEAEGEAVISATLARWLNVSPPAVTMATRRLSRDGLIRVRQGRITLTDAGREIAHRVLQRHHLIERMLAEVFGMEWYKVHDEAEQLEHAVSAEFEALLRAHLGEDPVCPHGNDTLPSALGRRERGWLPLREATIGTKARVRSVFERDRALLEYLDRVGLRPGTLFEVIDKKETIEHSEMSLSLHGSKVEIDPSSAQKIWISVED